MKSLPKFACFGFFLGTALALLALDGGPQGGRALAAEPQKQAHRVRMRDGVKLATDVYLPKGKGPFPVALVRTPYNKEEPNTRRLAAEGARRGYAVVVQDTRGRYKSEGANLPFEGDGWGKEQDGKDTLEWLVKQPWCSGKIGTLGGSALGITQLWMAATGTQRIACQHVSVAATSLYHQAVFPGGVFKKAMAEGWLQATGFSPEALKIWTRHPTFDDYWRERDVSARYGKMNAPAVHIGGWYDIFTQGTIDAFVGIQTNGGPQARGRQMLVMGPWTHFILVDRAGELIYPHAAAPPNRLQDPWRWLDAYLKGANNGVAREPAVTYYVMGDVSDPKAPGNRWRSADKWPPAPAKSTPFYLQEGKTLSSSKPAGGKPIRYTYDPKDPAPTLGGPQLNLLPGPVDQRPVEKRADVLVFTGPVLAEPLEVTGRVRVDLWASSDAPDTDFFAKLCDVYPDGRSLNVCEGALRARFHESWQRETFLKPGEIYAFEIHLGSTSIIFNKGHRLRVDVTSSSSPGYDPNPNTGKPFRVDKKTQPARNRIYVDDKHGSAIWLPVVAGGTRRGASRHRFSGSTLTEAAAAGEQGH